MQATAATYNIVLSTFNPLITSSLLYKPTLGGSVGDVIGPASSQRQFDMSI